MYPDLAIEAVRIGLVAGVQKDDGVYLEPTTPITREQSWLIDLRQQKLMSQIHMVPDLVKRYMPSVVRVWSSKGVGSGSYITPNIILTNAHVVGADKEVTVDTSFKKSIRGKVIKVGDQNTHGQDLALIEVDLSGQPIIIADTVVQGEPCLVLGNPAGEWQAVSAGIVMRFGAEYIQTDALVNPGNSGGAVINFSGKLIAVPTWKFVAQGFDNHNYCISYEMIKKFIQGVVK
jgi:S1-C subfamily serine protease